MITLRLVSLALLLIVSGIGFAQSWDQPAASSADEAQLWRWLRGGEAVALMRHALAPGTGDPANFTPGVCATQRNLSAEGREQAGAIGERFRANGITQASVYSSRWCRCLETARLLSLGEVEPFDGLNSFFRDRSAQAEHTAATRALIDQRTAPGGPPLVLVTHQVNITALTDIFPNSGEIIVVRPTATGLQVLGRLENP